MHNSEFTPEDIEKSKKVAESVTDALEFLGFYVESYQMRASLDPAIAEQAIEAGSVNTIDEIYQHGGILYLDGTFRLGEVAFSPRVQMTEEDKQVKKMLGDTGLAELDIMADEALNFSFEDDEEELNED